MADAPAECQQFLNQITSTTNALLKKLKAAKKIIDSAENLVGKMLKIPEPDLSKILDYIPDYGGDLTGALSKVLSCPVVADSPAGAQIAEALDMLNAGEDVPSELKDAISSDVRKGVGAGLDALKSDSPVDQIDKMKGMYDKALAAAGLHSALAAADALYDCIYAACQSYEDVTTAADSAMDKLDSAMEAGNLDPAGEVKDLVAGNDSYTQDVKDEYSQKKQALDDAKSAVENFNLPW